MIDNKVQRTTVQHMKGSVARLTAVNESSFGQLTFRLGGDLRFGPDV